jgi:dTDP-4-amino-4,6-dideoxygalactose transaminase
MSKHYGFAVIEDAAHSIGSSYVYRGQQIWCGSCVHSDLAIFSFHPVKTITTGEGGMVLTNDASLAHRVRMLASHGIERDVHLFHPWMADNQTGNILATNKSQSGGAEKAPWLYQQQALGYNYRITDIQSALGASQFARLDTIVARRREIVMRYQDAFASNLNLFCPPCPKDAVPAYHLYVLRFKDNNGTARLDAFTTLRNHGIFSQVHYIPVYLQPWYQQQYGYSAGKCPEAEAVYQSCLSIPLYPSMTDAEVDKVIQIINSFTRL